MNWNILASIVLSVFLLSPVPAGAKQTVSFKVVYTSDMAGHILPCSH